MILSSSFFAITYAEMSITAIKGLDAIPQKNHKHLSLVHGAVWWNNKLIENLYKNGNKKHATIQLLRNLFYLQKDLVTFDITTLNRNPARYFKESTIGIILAILEPYIQVASLTEEIKNELSVKLKKAIKNDINFKKHYQQARSTKEEIIKQAIATSQDFKNLLRLKKISQNIKNLREKQKKATKTEFPEISKIVTIKLKKQKRLVELYGSVNQLEKKFEIRDIFEQIHKEDLSKKSLNELVSFIIDAFEENLSSKNLYPPFTIQQIFLAFLWKIMESKDDLLLFIKSFEKYYETKDLIFSENAFNEYLNLPLYSKSDFELFKKEFISTISLKDLLEDYEKIVFFLFASNIWDSLLPPIIDSVAHSNYKGVVFPNCVETAIRNLINIIFFDRNSFIFNVTLDEELSNLGVIFDNKLTEFYLKNSDPLKAQLLKIYNAWNDVVSERSGVGYQYPKDRPFCNIKASFANFMKVVNHCMFGNSLSFDNLPNLKKIDILCRCAKQLNLTAEIKQSSDGEILNGFAIIVFKHNNNPLFELNFETKHCYLNVLQKNVRNYPINFSTLIEDFKIGQINYQNNLNNIKIINTLSFNTEETQIWFLTLSKDPSLVAKIQEISKIIIELLSFEESYLFIQKIILNKRKELYGVIGDIIQKNLTGVSSRVWSLILENHIKELYYLIQNNFSKLSKESKQLVLNNIINYKVSELYNFVHKEYGNYSENLLKTILKSTNNDLFELLEKSYSTKNKQQLFGFFKLIIKSGAQNFYPMIKKDIVLLDEEQQMELIKKIVKKQRSDLYPSILALKELPNSFQEQLKKVIAMQEQRLLFFKKQKKLKKTFRKLLNAPGAPLQEKLVNKLKVLNNLSHELQNNLPRSDIFFVSTEVQLLKQLKKLWINLLKKMNHIYENVLEDEEKNKLLKPDFKKYIQAMLKDLKKDKAKEVENINELLASLKS